MLAASVVCSFLWTTVVVNSAAVKCSPLSSLIDSTPMEVLIQIFSFADWKTGSLIGRVSSQTRLAVNTAHYWSIFHRWFDDSSQMGDPCEWIRCDPQNTNINADHTSLMNRCGICTLIAPSLFLRTHGSSILQSKDHIGFTGRIKVIKRFSDSDIRSSEFMSELPRWVFSRKTQRNKVMMDLHSGKEITLHPDLEGTVFYASEDQLFIRGFRNPFSFAVHSFDADTGSISLTKSIDFRGYFPAITAVYCIKIIPKIGGGKSTSLVLGYKSKMTGQDPVFHLALFDFKMDRVLLINPVILDIGLNFSRWMTDYRITKDGKWMLFSVELDKSHSWLAKSEVSSGKIQMIGPIAGAGFSVSPNERTVVSWGYGDLALIDRVWVLDMHTGLTSFVSSEAIYSGSSIFRWLSNDLFMVTDIGNHYGVFSVNCPFWMLVDSKTFPRKRGTLEVGKVYPAQSALERYIIREEYALMHNVLPLSDEGMTLIQMEKNVDTDDQPGLELVCVEWETTSNPFHTTFTTKLASKVKRVCSFCCC